MRFLPVFGLLLDLGSVCGGSLFLLLLGLKVTYKPTLLGLLPFFFLACIAFRKLQKEILWVHFFRWASLNSGPRPPAYRGGAALKPFRPLWRKSTQVACPPPAARRSVAPVMGPVQLSRNLGGGYPRTRGLRLVPPPVLPSLPQTLLYLSLSLQLQPVLQTSRDSLKPFP